MVKASDFQTVWEAQTYILLDTWTGKFVLPSYRRLLSDPFPMGQTALTFQVQAPPDEYDANNHSALYAVAYLHTHPRYDPHPNISTIKTQYAGQSKPGDDPNNPRLNDEDAARLEQPDFLGMAIPNLVYTFTGEELMGPGSRPVYYNDFVLPTGETKEYDYDSDEGKLWLFGWERRVNVRRRRS